MNAFSQVQFWFRPFFFPSEQTFRLWRVFFHRPPLSHRVFLSLRLDDQYFQTLQLSVYSPHSSRSQLQYGRSIEDHFHYQLRHKRSDFLFDHRNKLRIISNWFSQLILWHLWHLDKFKFISDRKSESNQSNISWSVLRRSQRFLWI